MILIGHLVFHRWNKGRATLLYSVNNSGVILTMNQALRCLGMKYSVFGDCFLRWL